MEREDFGVVGADLKNAGVEGVFGMERLIQAPRRWMGVVGVGVWDVGGVIGLELRGPEAMVRRAGRLSLPAGRRKREVESGVVGRGLLARGVERADPISERVSERTCMRRAGAMAGTWWDGEGGGLFMMKGEAERKASARRSSTMVLSSRMASSTSVFARRRLPGRVGAVCERGRDGEGRRERRRAPWVLERLRVEVGRSVTGVSERLPAAESSCTMAIVEKDPETGLEPFMLFRLERFEPDPTGFLWIRKDVVVEWVDMTESRSRTTACVGFCRSSLFHSSTAKSGNGERRPSPP